MSDLIVNLEAIEWVEAAPGGHFASRRKKLAAAAGAVQLGCSYYEVPPGKAAWPRHCHLGNEEAIYVLEGNATLLLGEQRFEVERGHWVALLANTGHAHQLYNTSDAPVRYLCFSTMEAPDIGYYPDSEKYGLFGGAAPGGAKDARTLDGFLPAESAVQYWHRELGESLPSAPLEVVRQDEGAAPLAAVADVEPLRLNHGEHFELEGWTLGVAAGSRKLGATVYRCRAGRASFPRHAHLANEEVIFVLEGTGVSFCGDDQSAIEAGDFIVYPAGEDYAHKVRADESGDLLYLCVSTRRSPEVVLYPDSDKVAAFGGRERLLLDGRARLGYWDREPDE